MQLATGGFSEGRVVVQTGVSWIDCGGRLWGRHGTSVDGRPALGHPLITVAIFLRGTSLFQQEQLRKDKYTIFRDTVHPTLRNPAYSTIHLTPAEGTTAEAKPTGLGIHKECQWLALVWGLSLTFLWTWRVLPAHMRAKRNSWLPADTPGLNIRGSALPRSGKYHGKDSDMWLLDRETHLPSSTTSDQHLPLMGDPEISFS